MTPFVVGLNGSPRREGNSATLLGEALQGAEAHGARTARFDLAFMNISPCTACDECFSFGECVLEDDMSLLYKALEEADVVIICSPIYFSGISSYTKLAVDRCQALWARRKVLRIPRRPGRGAIVLCAAQPAARFDNAVSELRAFLLGIGITPKEVMRVPGAGTRTYVRESEELRASARALGRAMVNLTNPGPWP